MRWLWCYVSRHQTLLDTERLPMNRSGRIMLVCHCLLNANSKIYPLSSWQGVHREAIQPHIDEGTGILQLPCPEASYLGMNRWGMTREQYDHMSFRDHCERILLPSFQQIEAFMQAGYAIAGVVGMDGSPNCGVTWTSEGFTGGEICSTGSVLEQARAIRRAAGPGVFMGIVASWLRGHGVFTRFLAVNEISPDESNLSE